MKKILQSKRSGRTRKGTLEEHSLADGTIVFDGRLRLLDGSKSARFRAPSGMTREQATTWLAGEQAQEDVDHAVFNAMKERARDVAAANLKPNEIETCSTWHERFLKSRDVDVTSSRGRWRKWIAPHIGHLQIREVTREDMERVRDAIDEAIRAFQKHGRADGRLMPKAAVNVWSVLTTAMKHACASKDRGLRVRDDNPCAGVLPPDRGESRRKPYLYPVEADALIACASVPSEWRRLYAIALYTYLRPNELCELRWKDVNLDAGLISISRAWDWNQKVVKSPKTRNGVRTIPIHPELRPLLAFMAKGKEKKQDELVVQVLKDQNDNKTAIVFRSHLVTAGVDSPRLHADTKTHMRANFRSCRDTGITWLAMQGVALQTIQRRSGHDDMNTTMGYVRAAEDFSEGTLGTPFSPIPRALWTTERSTFSSNDRIIDENECRRRESKADEVQVFSADRETNRPGTSEIPPRNTGDAEAVGPSIGPPTEEPNEVERALASALSEAAKAGRWDVVCQLASELEARRLAASGKVTSQNRVGRGE